MKQFIDNLFTRESAIRHLIQLGISILITAWMYVFFALTSKDWAWLSFDTEILADPKLLWENIFGIMFFIFVSAVAGVLTYWNAKKWMLSCLKKSGLYFLGAIPLVNLLVPEEMRHSWLDEIDYLRTPTTVTTYSDGLGDKFSVDNGMVLILAIPLGLIRSLFKGLGLSVLNLIAAIGIPVLSPLFLILALIVITLLAEANLTAGVIVGFVCLFAVIALFVVHPIIAFIKEKSNK